MPAPLEGGFPLRSRARLCLALVGVAAAAAPACRSQGGLAGGPLVRQERVAAPPHALRKLAIIPFYPAESLGEPGPGAPPGDPSPKARWEIAAQVSNQMAEALATEGISIVPPNDVELAFVGEGHPVPRLDPVAATQLAGLSFGASSVLLGKVTRYREREGGAAGSTHPASVAFEVSLHQVPGGRRLWSGRFDESQQSLTANLLRARQYPGGGTRWLTASEFARWGAGEVARALAEAQGG